MPIRSLVPVVVLLAGLPAMAEGPGLGRPLATEEIPSYATYIMPDGSGLPDGQGSVQQGQELYAAQCASCHGSTGVEGPITPLVSPDAPSTDARLSQAAGSHWPYATTLFEYIRRAMPFQDPKSLTNDEVYAVTAYILFRNGVIAEEDIVDATSLPAIVMPNREGFIDLWASQGDEPY